MTLADGPREYVATDYAGVLDRWTRTKSLFLFDELTRALTVTATFESWDFRWAYVIRYAQDFRLTIPERQALLERRLSETRGSHEFFVSLAGADDRQSDLAAARPSWIVRLIDSTGTEAPPSALEPVARPDALERRYYPHHSVWRRAYRIRFAALGSDGRPVLAPTAQWFGLRFAGPWGNTDVTWALESPR